MKKYLITASILILTAALTVLGIFMPKIAFSYQNDTLISQVEKDQMEEVSFLYSSDNEVLNILQIFASNNYMITSDEREVSTDDKLRIKREVSLFLDTLSSYNIDFYITYGYIGGSGNTVSFDSGLIGSYSIEPCFLIYNTNNEQFDDYEIEQSGNSSISDDTGDASSSIERPVWMVTSSEIIESINYVFYIDDTSCKVYSFYLYNNSSSEENYMTTSDINKYIYIFTNLFTDYYELTVEYCQSDIDIDSYVTIPTSGNIEVFDCNLIYTITDPSNSDNYAIMTVYISNSMVGFNLDSSYWEN